MNACRRNALPVVATGARRSQRGVAALVVVMVLLFIVSLVTAYASRNLVFEQRTSTNQIRATQAFEAAEAGIEWALAMLDSGRIDAACEPTADPASSSFRRRYLTIAADGLITPVANPAGGDLMPSCVFDGTSWQCSCPTTGAPTLATPTGAGPFPAFRLRFVPAHAPAQPGLIRIEANGCTSTDDNCLNFEFGSGQPERADGRATLRVIAGLASGAKTPPAAALTLFGDLTGSGTVNAYNADAAAGGIARDVGGSIDPLATLTLGTVAGSPSAQALLQPDASLSSIADLVDPGVSAELVQQSNRRFAKLFGLTPKAYREQPAARVLRCPCDADTVHDEWERHPDLPLWLDGDFTLDAPVAIGSASEPVTIVVDGSLTSTDPNAQITGLVYVRGDWGAAGSAKFVGAAVAEGDLNLDPGSASTFDYDAGVLGTLRVQSGSFVRVPGSWRDFPRPTIGE
jgi:hypothetical protein